ncbi:MAG: GAF domain-containing protein [Pseudomonadota bacterium]
MNNAEPLRFTDETLAELIGFIHRGAAADDFSALLARAESSPAPGPHHSRLVECIRMAMAVRNRLELQLQRERGLLAVIESAQDLSSRLDLMELLHAIVSRARVLLGSHVAWLSVYDQGLDAFQVRVSDGALSASTDKMTARRNYGVASTIMSTRLPFTTPDYLQDKRFPHDEVLDETFRTEGIAALVGAPLIYNNEVIGLLFVADRYHRSHTALEVSILCTLATHAAVAIKNAKAFELASTALRNADMARAELERHSRNVHAAAEAHERLTSLLAQGASLGTLCQAVAQLMGGSVLVVDEAFQAISQGSAEAYDGASALNYSPHGEYSSAIVKAARDSRKAGLSVVAYQNGAEVCRVIVVIGGDDVLGALLLFSRADLTDIAIRTFERSSSVIGVVLLSSERMEINKSRDITTLLRGLLSPHQTEMAAMHEQASRFSLDLSQPLTLVVIEADRLKAVYVAKRLRAGLAMPGLVLDEFDGIIAIVCETRKVQECMQTCSAHLKADLGDGYRGILSRPVARASELPALYSTLRRGLLVAQRLGVNGQILGQNEMALYSVLFETHNHASLDSFLETVIGVLIAHDRKRSTGLCATLLCYFDSNQNARLSAKRLDIHVNTVRQRLASAEELLGHWGSASRALELHMALRLWSLSRCSDASDPLPVEH